MKKLQHSRMYISCLLLLGILPSSMFANAAEPLAPNDSSAQSIQKEIQEATTQPILDKKKLPTELPSDTDDNKVMSKEESRKYLSEHPQEMEKVLQLALAQGNKEALQDLLPIYEKYPQKDQSVIDWGNAIILAREGKLDQAISLYRKINAQLPDIKLLRFQMAMALFYNRQFDAAKSEFEKLRSSTESEADLKAINQYLDAISRQNKWDINASLSYLDDNNLTNEAPVGTTLTLGNGAEVSTKSEHESGQGINFGLYADKKWLNDNRLFTALHLNTNGNYYWNNKKFNDATAGAGVGFGYQTAITEAEIQPFYSKRWYGGGRNGSDTLKSYADSYGVKGSINQWINPKFRYQGFVRLGRSEYEDSYKYNDGSDTLFASTLIYLPNQKQFFTAGIDKSAKNARDDFNSFRRSGMRFGWGQTWPKGFSTRVNVGYAKRLYNAEDYFGIKRENKEYSAGLTLWNRGFSILGLTPRLSLDHYEVKSNSALEEYSKNNVSVELTKTF